MDIVNISCFYSIARSSSVMYSITSKKKNIGKRKKTEGMKIRNGTRKWDIKKRKKKFLILERISCRA